MKWYPDINMDGFIEAFVLDEKMLKAYILETEPFIYKMGCNKNRLEIRPIIKLDNDMVYMSYALLDRAMNLWYSYLVNGGRPYTGIESGHGDSLIDGCWQRENELGDVTVGVLVSMLEKYCQADKFKGIDVGYGYSGQGADYGQTACQDRFRRSLHSAEQFLELGMIRQTKVEGRRRRCILTEKGKEMLEEEYRCICAQELNYQRIFGQKRGGLHRT